MIRIAMVVLAALALLVNLAAAEEQGAAGRHATDSLSVILNLYDLGRAPAGTIEVLSPHVRPTDVFNLVSGNRRGQADLVSINRWATILHERFPKNDIWAMTSGLANVKLLAEGRKKIPTCVTTIVYDYEPNWGQRAGVWLGLRPHHRELSGGGAIGARRRVQAHRRADRPAAAAGIAQAARLGLRQARPRVCRRRHAGADADVCKERPGDVQVGRWGN